MTDREKAIVMAHTGICMLAGDKFQIFHQYVEDILGRPVQTIEMGMESIADEIKEKSREDFIALCMEEQEPCEDAISRQAVLKAIDAKAWEFCDYLIREGRNDEQKPVSHFADNLRECVGEDLPPVTPQPKIGSSSEKPNKWIPVGEKLPEIHQDVILSLRSLDIEVGFRAETEPYFYCHGADGRYIDPKNVLAWMHLPKPYKQEVEE